MPGLHQPSSIVRDIVDVVGRAEWEDELASLRTSLSPGSTLDKWGHLSPEFLTNEIMTFPRI